MIRAFFGLDKHIVNIDFHCPAHQWPEYLGHQSLIGCSDVLQTKGHHIVAVYPVQCNKGHFLRNRRVHWNLVVAGEGIQK